MRNFKVVHEIKINTTGLKKDVIMVPVGTLAVEANQATYSKTYVSLGLEASRKFLKSGCVLIQFPSNISGYRWIEKSLLEEIK